MEEGDIVFHDWTVRECIGKGAFGKVYRISRKDFGKEYEAALKVIKIPQEQAEVDAIRSEGLEEESVTDYFNDIVKELVKEIDLMTKLKGNSNIVSYEDHRVVEKKDAFGWKIYIRMELLKPFTSYIREHTLTVQDVIKLGIDICHALEICQEYNIIHRDIKPENIFVSKLGDFKLGDFGIARQLEKTSSGLSKKGTYTYMAPEIYNGLPYNSTVDIYSLGIVLYRFLNNNRSPFLPAAPTPIRFSDREEANVMRMSGKKLPEPCNATGRLAEIVLKACAYDPKERYESAYEMRQALQSVMYSEVEEADVEKTEDKEEETVEIWRKDSEVKQEIEFADDIPVKEEKKKNLEPDPKRKTVIEKIKGKMPVMIAAAGIIAVISIIGIGGFQKMMHQDEEKKANVLSEKDDYQDSVDTETKETEINESEFVIEDGCLMSYQGTDEEVEIPEGVWGINGYAFSNCKNLTSIEIPSDVVYIGEGAFFNCNNLVNIKLSAGLTEIRKDTFEDCSSLTSIEIPASVTSIGENAFENCSSLTSIEIPANVTKIGKNAFSGCSSLTDIEIPANVTNIGDSAFFGCSSLTDIEIPANVTDIEENTFSGCRSLANVELSSGITRIWENAFSDCSSLTSIKIPANVTGIGEYAFSNCIALKNVEICSSSDVFVGKDVFFNCTNLKNVKISAGMTTIGKNMFFGCKNLTNVEMPSSITTIKEGAFNACENLVNIKIPFSIDRIGKNAFSCTGLICVEIPDCSVDKSAFSDCYSLIAVAIPYDDFVGVKFLNEINTDKDFKIYCHKNSYAYEYAKKNGFDCVVVKKGIDVGKAMRKDIG